MGGCNPPNSPMATPLSSMLRVKQEAVNTNFKVISLTRIGMKPESAAPEADALTTWPSKLLRCVIVIAEQKPN